MDFPAKILLFGEYGIILNSMALAIPYPRFSGRFRCPESPDQQPSGKEVKSNTELRNLLKYLKNDPSKFKFLDLFRFEDELNKGLYFDSSIPHGSGLGSSGALTAAFYSRYPAGEPPTDYPKIKAELAAIESCFHGRSSGIDPFTSYLKRPVFLDNQGTSITTGDLSPFFKTYTLFLINTNSNGNTGDLVTQFMNDYQIPEFRRKIDLEYIPLINQTIGSVLAADFETFASTLNRYSEFQLSCFKQMIPVPLNKYFEHGLRTGDFNLKLCGSGGGGYVLAISRDRFKAEAYFNLNHLEYTVV
jgi:mevalonate kinase